MLSTLAAGTIGVLSDLLVPVDLDLNLLHIRLHIDRSEARFPFALGTERGDTHQPVHPGLARQVPKCVGTLDQQAARLNAGALPISHSEFLELILITLEVSQIHAQKHLRPVTGIVTAGAGLDVEKTVPLVLGPGEQGEQLDLVGAVAQAGELALDFGLGIGVVLLGGELQQDGEILGAGEQLLDRLDLAAERLELPNNNLGGFLVAPEAGLLYLRGKLLDAGTLDGEVKGSPGWRGSGQ